jgi:cell wall-associated NlpC family hydrolase
MEETMKGHLWRKIAAVLLASAMLLGQPTELIYAAEVTESAETSDATDSTVLSALSSYNNLGVCIASDFLNIRKSASSTSTIVGRMKPNNVCEVLSSSGSWYKVKSGKVTGYAYGKYIATGSKAVSLATATLTNGSSLKTATVVEASESSSDDTRASLVSFAKQFVGNPYKWGGTSLTKGADCSGFTLSVYAKYGVSLPHSSSAQPSYGKKVKLSNIQPGDLLFYGSGRSISHVAIYIGNGKIVHAANAKSGIKISSAYYSSPVCAVSYLN